jgi:hypothetical protein
MTISRNHPPTVDPSLLPRALLAPATRTVVVEASADENADGTWSTTSLTYAALALVALPGDTGEYDVIVIDPDFGICEAKFAFGDVANGSYRVVACPWSPEEDAERLAPVVQQVGEEAIENAKAFEERRRRDIAKAKAATPRAISA